MNFNLSFDYRFGDKHYTNNIIFLKLILGVAPDVEHERKPLNLERKFVHMHQSSTEPRADYLLDFTTFRINILSNFLYLKLYVIFYNKTLDFIR